MNNRVRYCLNWLAFHFDLWRRFVWIVDFVNTGNTRLQRFKMLRFLFYAVFSKKKTVRKIMISPSYVCQMHCYHCFNCYKDDRDVLSTEQIKRYIDFFDVFLHGYSVCFIGGEVLLRSDLCELIEYCYHRGFLTEIVTNGWELEDKVTELKKSGLSRCFVSIDSPIEKIHDSLRCSGSFKRSIEGIKLLVKNGIIVQIWTYVSKENENDLIRLGVLARELRVQGGVYVFLPVFIGGLDSNSDLTLEERERIRRRVKGHNIIMHQTNERTECQGGGNDFVAISPSGEITCCPVMNVSYGSMDSNNFVDILQKMRRDLKDLDDQPCRCG